MEEAGSLLEVSAVHGKHCLVHLQRQWPCQQVVSASMPMLDRTLPEYLWTPDVSEGDLAMLHGATTYTTIRVTEIAYASQHACHLFHLVLIPTNNQLTLSLFFRSQSPPSSHSCCPRASCFLTLCQSS
jgi:hypothetical protein